jgi:hypothetical protein
MTEPPLVRAGSCWFRLVEGILEEGFGVFCLSKKESFARFCTRVAVFLFTWMAPRRALQLAHEPTMLVLS